MDDHRARHHAQYLEREKERTEIIERTKKLETLVESIQIETSIMGLYKIVKSVADTLRDNLDKQKLAQIGLGLVEAINTNGFISIDFNNTIHVTASQEVQITVKSILGRCGIDDTIEVQYNMDCSRDEELARELAQTAPPVVRRPRGRPRKVTRE
jgi:hypothetical protein